MPKNRLMQILGGVIILFTVLAGVVVYLARARIIGIELAILMLIALLGLYVGFGIMIFAYRFVSRLD